ncbi:hypothetical protein JQR85_09010 [Stutzerimonas urumqiensis]|uniref:hypothetical protein n=1 Tax=Stutzerimonas urumqiensis TaxID=638269 RepID=UPI000EB0115C|nr:hypothetical protein [Stutzerimonas urumqiensis]
MRHDPIALNRLANLLMSSGLGLLLVGVLGAYVLDGSLTLPAIVLAHALTILGPSLVKIGYVMRLAASRQARFA